MRLIGTSKTTFETGTKTVEHPKIHTMSYIPAFSLNTVIYNQSIAIAEKVGLLKEANVFKDMHLRKANRVKTIYASCAIENNSLTLDEVTAILNGKPVIGPLDDILEVQNAASAYEHFEQYQPFCVDDLLRAHGCMTHHAVAESGQFRTQGVGIIKGGQIVHQGAPSHWVPQLIQDLFDWAQQSDAHPLLKSCIVHYEIENIHPFADGNGRMGRLWQSVILAQYDELFRYIPIESLIYDNQQAYYDALQTSHDAGHCNAFIEFMLSMIANTLNEVFIQWNADGRPLRTSRVTDKVTDRVTDKVTDLDRLVIEQLQMYPSATFIQLAELLGVSRKTIASHIQQLKARGVIERIGSDRKGSWKILK